MTPLDRARLLFARRVPWVVYSQTKEPWRWFRLHDEDAARRECAARNDDGLTSSVKFDPEGIAFPVGGP